MVSDRIKSALTASVPRRSVGRRILVLHAVGWSLQPGFTCITRANDHLDKAESLGIQVDIHLDDAYASALPFGAELIARGHRVSLALPTGLLTGDRIEGLLDAPLAATADIDDFVRQGGILVPHGHRHLHKSLHQHYEVLQDALAAVRHIRDYTGEDPVEFVAPYGKTSRWIVRELRAAGIDTVHVLSHISSAAFTSRTLSGRYCIENSTSPAAEDFLLSPVNDFRLRPN